MSTADPAAQPASSPPALVASLRVVVMGVSGCGKSTVGSLVAQGLGAEFIEGDSLHPPRNLALMAAGTPLTDADRADWLASIAQLLGQARRNGQGMVVSCSALKHSYRNLLRAACPGLRWVYLQGSPEQLQARLQARTGHYMPPSLLASQLATLEPPGTDEATLVFEIDPSATVIAASALAQLSAPAAP